MTENRPPAPTGPREAGTREALFDAALDLFAAKGFDGATVDEIARAAGANKAMISYHFGGKDRLHEAILQELFEAVSARMAEVRDADLPAEEKLARYIRLFADLNQEKPQFSTFVLREILSGGAHLDDRLLPRFLFIFECIRGIVLQGVREGAFRPVNPLLTHLGVVGAMVFFFASTPFRKRLADSGTIPVAIPPVDEFVAHLTQATLRGLGKETR